LHEQIDATDDLAAEVSLLGKLSRELGDAGITERWWDIDEDWDLSAVNASIWDSLEQQGLVVRGRHRNKTNAYRLTDAGWTTGIEAAGTLASEDFRGRCQALVAYFESQLALQRMPRGAVISPHRLEADGFRSGWVLNVLRNGLLRRVFPDRCMDARWEPALHNVRVLPGFGSPLSVEAAP
jgi:hypothetical protein